ncbi:hypothetical protein [Mycolicibacterium sp. HK-90]|uniref:hypothetical protein n=1 Tax=Mycolicibacterium sp. HK-90 TaxID=3056937 RepID=UPI002657E400|nr:hypothetical protein [Mycolicibacterium sp. HK-90]WKG06860.1 hypothetical protein QU592_04530 [Mycolicibacterium sp. HK-90]
MVKTSPTERTRCPEDASAKFSLPSHRGCCDGSAISSKMTSAGAATSLVAETIRSVAVLLSTRRSDQISQTGAKVRMPKLMRGLALFVTGLCALMCWLWAYAAFQNHAYITVFIALALSVTPLYIAAMTRVSNEVAPQVAFDSAGTWLRPDLHIEALLHRLVVAGIVSMSMLVAAWLGGVLYQGPFEEVGHVMPISLGVVALMLIWIWWRTKSHGGSSYLILSPDGFEFPGLFTVNRGRWDDVVALVDDDPEAGRFWGVLDFSMKEGEKLRMESTGIYTPGGEALYELVHFYWMNPEQRKELTDGRALDRLDSMQSGGRPDAKR